MQYHSVTRHLPFFSPQGLIPTWPSWHTLASGIDAVAAIALLSTAASELLSWVVGTDSFSTTLGWIKGSIGIFLVMRQLRQHRGENQ